MLLAKISHVSGDCEDGGDKSKRKNERKRKKRKNTRNQKNKKKEGESNIVFGDRNSY